MYQKPPYEMPTEDDLEKVEGGVRARLGLAPRETRSQRVDRQATTEDRIEAIFQSRLLDETTGAIQEWCRKNYSHEARYLRSIKASYIYPQGYGGSQHMTISLGTIPFADKEFSAIRNATKGSSHGGGIDMGSPKEAVAALNANLLKPAGIKTIDIEAIRKQAETEIRYGIGSTASGSFRG
jgi:hypothetical protein